MVKINGKPLDCAGKTVKDALIRLGFDLSRVAVEVNGELVPRAKHADFVLKDADTVEAVSFVGGG